MGHFPARELVKNPRAVQVVIHDEEKPFVPGDLAQRALRELVQLGRAGELDQERVQASLLGHCGHTQEDLPRFRVLGDRLERLEILHPLAEHQPSNAELPPLVTDPARSSASASSSSWTSLSTGISRPRAVTRAGKPVKVS